MAGNGSVILEPVEGPCALLWLAFPEENIAVEGEKFLNDPPGKCSTFKFAEVSYLITPIELEGNSEYSPREATGNISSPFDEGSDQPLLELDEPRFIDDFISKSTAFGDIVGIDWLDVLAKVLPKKE